MKRFPSFALSIWVFGVLPLVGVAQNRDPRVDALAKDNADLKQRIAEQDRRIGDLEKAVRALAAAAHPSPNPIPAPRPAWYAPESWVQIKPGMSEMAVTDILGQPTSVRTAVDVRTLYYESDAKSTQALKGSVTLMDDRVTQMTPPIFTPPPQ